MIMEIHAVCNAQVRHEHVGVESNHLCVGASVEERVATFMTLALYRKVQRIHPQFVTPSWRFRHHIRAGPQLLRKVESGLSISLWIFGRLAHTHSPRV